VNDARYYLNAADERYDVIVSDLFVPWHSQTGYLYTVEHYEAARRRLASGGLFCQWLPLYQLGERELAMICDSFAQAFPQVTLWRGDAPGESPILALIGTEAPLSIDRDELARRIGGLGAFSCGEDPLLESPIALQTLYRGDWPRPAAGTPLNTDEHPRVEFLAPLSHRGGLLLEGERLKEYEREVLDKLGHRGAVFYDRPPIP
jgi:spermidine synthase